MSHASDGVLRRLEDEPFAIADSTFEHVAGCRRCRARREVIGADAAAAARRLSRPQPVPDVDLSWLDFMQHLDNADDRAPLTRIPLRSPRPARRLAAVSLRGGLLAGAVAVALAGSAAAATLTNVFAPTHVAPLEVTASDFQAIAGLMNIQDTSGPGGFPTTSGTGYLPFGTLRWSSSGSARTVQSASEAQALTGVKPDLPAHLPGGVGSPMGFGVQPKATATITFDSAAGKLAGASVKLDVGPAVLVGYGSRPGSADVPTMGVLTMPRPTATSTGATIGQVEAFLLSQPGIPPQLSEEIRLLGDISTVIPVPAPSGMTSRSVHVGGQPAVLISDRSGVGSAVVWEDGAGLVHAVAGLLDQRSVLNVADQLR